MTTKLLSQPVVRDDLKAGDLRLLRGLATGWWLTDVTDAAQAQRLLTLGYIVATAEGYEITNAGRQRIGFAKVDG